MWMIAVNMRTSSICAWNLFVPGHQGVTFLSERTGGDTRGLTAAIVRIKDGILEKILQVVHTTSKVDDLVVQLLQVELLLEDFVANFGENNVGSACWEVALLASKLWLVVRIIICILILVATCGRLGMVSRVSLGCLFLRRTVREGTRSSPRLVQILSSLPPRSSTSVLPSSSS